MIPSQTGLVATKKARKSSKGNSILWGLTIQHFSFLWKLWKWQQFVFRCIEFMSKISSFFFVYCCSKLLKIEKILDRQSLVNVALKIRTKFHSNRLVRFRDILHVVSNNLVSRETRFQVSERRFFSHLSFTYFSSLTRRNSQLSWIQAPWHSIRQK